MTAAIDEAGMIVARMRRSTPRDDYDGTIEAIAGLVSTVESRLDCRCSVGVANCVSLGGAALELDGGALTAAAASSLHRSRRLTRTADGRPTSTPLSTSCVSSRLTTGGGT